MVGLAGVTIDGGCGLGTQIADLLVEVECADTVSTTSAVELHAALDALDSISFH